MVVFHLCIWWTNKCACFFLVMSGTVITVFVRLLHLCYCNLIILHDIGIWNEQGKTMDPQLSTETLKNLTKDIYLCFSLYHKISVDDQFSNYHIYNNRKYSEITMMLHLNIESILKINCITPETNSLIHCININLPKTLPSYFFHNFS